MSQVGRVMRVTVSGEVKSRAPLSQKGSALAGSGADGTPSWETLTRASRKSDGPTEALSSDVCGENCFSEVMFEKFACSFNLSMVSSH